MSKFEIRNADNGDINFIVNSWLKSYRASCPLVSDLVYFDYQKRLIMKIFETATVTLAIDPDDPAHIFGYIVHEGSVIHYCYVKHSLRRFGIARALLATIKADHFITTHLSYPARQILGSNPGMFLYNPYKIGEIK